MRFVLVLFFNLLVSATCLAGNIAIFVDSANGFGHFNIAKVLSDELIKENHEIVIVSSTGKTLGKSFFNSDCCNHLRIHHLPSYTFNPDLEKSRLIDEYGISIFSKSGSWKERTYESTKLFLDSFEPDIIIFEIYPFIMKQRKSSLNAVIDFKNSGNKVKIFCLCRDIIHPPSEEETADILKILRQNFDGILVRGDSSFAQISESSSKWNEIESQCKYMGFFVSKKFKELCNNQSETQNKDHVLVFGGGGFIEDDIHFFNTVIKSKNDSSLGNLNWLIFISSVIPNHHQKYLQKLADENGIKIKIAGDQEYFWSIMFRSKLCIIRSGYNSTAELLYLRSPFITIFRSDKKEQKLRSELLSKMPNIVALSDEKNLLTKSLLANSIKSVIQESNICETSSFEFNGAECMAAFITKQL